MGVGSEVYGAVTAGRPGIGIELKPSYYRQAKRNVEFAARNPDTRTDQRAIEFAEGEDAGVDIETVQAAGE